MIWSYDSLTLVVSGAATHSSADSAAKYLNVIVLESDYSSTGKFQMHLAVVIVTVDTP